MLKWLIRNRLTAFEKKYDYDASYMRELLEIDSKAFFAFARAARLGGYKRDVPEVVHFAVGLVGTVTEDCGPCTQLGVSIALEQGVPASVLQAVLSNDLPRMPDDVRLGVQFARAVLAHAPEADGLREEIVKRWGPRGLVSLAFALNAARLYPTMKYAMGHGRACQRIQVGGQPVAVVRGAA
jgi:hypothetical protein